MTTRPLRLLTIGHSYVVALNRRLPHEIARVSEGRWEVTAVAPRFVSADLRDIVLEAGANEACALEAVDMHFTSRLHIATFGRRLRELLRRDWDMVHIFQDPYIVPGWQSAYWTPRQTPFVFYTCQNITKRYPPPFSWMEQYCLDRCAGWIGCGEKVIAAMLKKDYGKRPYRCIGFGVDMEMFRPDQNRRQQIRQLLGWDDSIPVVAFLGRMVPQKGLSLLSAALDNVSFPWRALFIGNGPMQPTLEIWARKYPGQVRFASLLHDEVPAYLNAADILCAPSQTMSNVTEQFGRMIVEAFASGLAVVGSDSGEIPYVIGDAGLVVGEADQAGWTKALDRLLEDEALRADLSQRGLKRAIEHFAWPVIARRHVEFFDQILAGTA